MKFVQLLQEKLEFKTPDDVVVWVDTLQIPKRKPKSISKVEHDAMIGLYTLVQDYKKTKTDRFSNFGNKLNYTKSIIMDKLKQLRLPKEEYNTTYSNVDSQPTTIKKKYATYIKFDSTAYDIFTKNINMIEKFLASLKGYHSKVLKNLKIKFVSQDQLRAKASYKTEEDTLYINARKMGKSTEEYGSLVYVVLHELGHRYLRYNNQNWNIDDTKYTTTKYSTVDSFTNEEKFAELFALTHWPKKYKEYQTQMDMFKNNLK